MRKPLRNSVLACFVLAMGLPVVVAAQQVPEPARPPQPGAQLEPGPPRPPRPESPLLPGTPDSLEEMIDIALANNPEIQLAEATLRQAEAQLNAARMRVVQEVTELHAQREALRRNREEAERHMATVEGQWTAGIATETALAEARQEMAELDQREGELRARAGYALGLAGPPMRPVLGTPGLPEAPMVPRPRPNEIGSPMKEMLRSPVSIEFDEVPVGEIFRFLIDTWSINIVPQIELPPFKIPCISLADVALQDALEALADQCPPLCFVVRDYGLLATTRERAMCINAPTIPADVPLFVPEEPMPPPPLQRMP